jgi:hypothetical protein
MEYLYIVDPANFTGHALNTMPFVEKSTRHGMELVDQTYVHYHKWLTFEEYNKQHDGRLLALTWDEFNTQFYSAHLKGLCKEFKPISKEDFWDALECLPPKRWTRTSTSEFFFLGECFTANLYSCFVRKGENYFSALRPINTPDEEIFNLTPILSDSSI